MSTVDIEMRSPGTGRKNSQEDESWECNCDFCCSVPALFIWICLSCCLVVGILLTVILIPLSFSYVEWNELALRKNSLTNKVDRSEVFANGRYFWGLTISPLIFPSTFQLISFRGQDLAVFAGAGDQNRSAGAGLEFFIEADIWYRLDRDLIPEIFNDFGTIYHDRLVDAIRASIKNTAPEFSVDDFVSRRPTIAHQMWLELNKDLTDLHLRIEEDKFLLNSIYFPNSLILKFQETVLKKLSIDQALLNRDVNLYQKGTEELVQAIEANITVIQQTGLAQAEAVVLEANATSVRIYQEALGIGLQQLVSSLNITDSKTRTKMFQLFTILDNPQAEKVIVGDDQGLLRVS